MKVNIARFLRVFIPALVCCFAVLGFYINKSVSFYRLHTSRDVPIVGDVVEIRGSEQSGRFLLTSTQGDKSLIVSVQPNQTLCTQFVNSAFLIKVR